MRNCLCSVPLSHFLPGCFPRATSQQGPRADLHSQRPAALENKARSLCAHQESLGMCCPFPAPTSAGLSNTRGERGSREEQRRERPQEEGKAGLAQSCLTERHLPGVARLLPRTCSSHGAAGVGGKGGRPRRVRTSPALWSTRYGPPLEKQASPR